MFPAVKGNYWRAAVTACAGIVLLIAEIFGLVRVWRGPAYPSSALPIVPLLLVMFLPMGVFTAAFSTVQILGHERDLRAALDGDERRAPRAATQPNLARALGHDERLALTRTINLRAAWWMVPLGLMGAVFGAPVLALFGVLCVYLISPHMAGWIVVPLFEQRNPALHYPPPPLSPLEWLVLALVAAPGFAFGLLVLWGQLAILRQTISADDAGISVRGLVGRRQFVPWDDIHAIIAVGADPIRPDSLLLRGDRHGLTLPLDTTSSPPRANGKPRAAIYRFSGGTDAYRDGVARLLGTVVARGHVPIRTLARPALRSAPGRVPLPDELTPDQVLRMPLAAGPETQAPSAPSSSASTGQVITLRATISPQVLVKRTGAIFLMWCTVAGCFDLMYFLAGRTDPNGAHAGMHLANPMVLAGLAGFLLLVSWCLAYAIYREYVAPTVVADASGIQLRKVNGMPSSTVLWKDMRAWAVILPDDLMPVPPTYAVFTDQQTLSWQEPLTAKLAGRAVHGDRHAAYQATAQQLHALIAARTGLPLRRIVPRAER